MASRAPEPFRPDGPGDRPGGWPENGSSWLREHHAELVRIEPRVLVLDVVNKPAVEITTLDDLLPALVSAFADGSRYHGYSDPNAQPFLSYVIDKVVDLKDPGGAEYPDFWPPQTPNGWDVGQLFAPELAPRLGYEGPVIPTPLARRRLIDGKRGDTTGCASRARSQGLRVPASRRGRHCPLGCQAAGAASTRRTASISEDGVYGFDRKSTLSLWTPRSTRTSSV